MRRFAENVPEDLFTAALESSTDPKFVNFLAARINPLYKNHSLASLARKFNVTLADLDDLYRNYQLHVGMVRMMEHVPQVLVDVAEDAKSRIVVCSRCDGEGKLLDEKQNQRECPVCNGIGRVRQSGDKAARDLVFESIGLIGKRGPMVAIQNNFGLDSGLEDTLLSTAKLISATTVTGADQ